MEAKKNNEIKLNTKYKPYSNQSGFAINTITTISEFIQRHVDTINIYILTKT